MTFNANEFRQKQAEPESTDNKTLIIVCSIMAVLTAGFVGYPMVADFRADRVEANQVMMANAEKLSDQRRMEREIQAQRSGIGKAAQGLRMRKQAMSSMNELMAEHRVGAEPVKRVESGPQDIDEILSFPNSMIGDIRRYETVKMIARTCEKKFQYPVSNRANYMTKNIKALKKINKTAMRLQAEAAAAKEARLKGRAPKEKMELNDIENAGDYFKWRMQGGSPTNMAMDNMSGMADMMSSMDDFERGNGGNLPEEPAIPRDLKRAANMLPIPPRSRRTKGWSRSACSHLFSQMQGRKLTIKA